MRVVRVLVGGRAREDANGAEGAAAEWKRTKPGKRDRLLDPTPLRTRANLSSCQHLYYRVYHRSKHHQMALADNFKT